MREIVIGSRVFASMHLATDYVNEAIARGMEIGSGGAGGVDSCAESTARLNGQVPYILRAEWGLYGKAAGKRRNWPLVYSGQHVQAFWDGWSNGTAHAVTAAVALGVPVNVTLPVGFPRLWDDSAASDRKT
jgi:hypothetical protein